MRSAETISAVRTLSAVAGHYGLELSPEGLRRRFDLTDDHIPMEKVVRMARENGLEAKHVRLSWQKVVTLGEAFPAIGILDDGSAVVLSGVEEGETEAEDRLVLFDLHHPGGRLDFRARPEMEKCWRGDAILVKKRDAGEEDAETFSLRWFLPRMAAEKRIFIEIAVIAMVMHGLAFAVPLYFQNVVDRVLSHQAATTLTVLGIGVCVAIMFEGLLRYLREYLLRFATAKIDLSLAMSTFSHMVRLPLQFFERSFAGVVVKHMQQADQIREFLTGNMLDTILDASSLLVFIPVLFLYSPQLTMLVLGFAGMTALIIALMIGPFHRRLMALYQAEGRRQALLVETIHGVGTVKSLALEPSRNSRWEEGAARAVTSTFAVDKISAAARAVIKTLERLMTVAVIWMGTRGVFEGTLSVGALIAFQMLSQNVTAPLVRIVEMVHEYQKTRLAVRMLGEIMNRKAEPGLSRAGTRPVLQGGIEFRGVGFSYTPGGTPALADIDLCIEPGEVVGIVGRSGSGKTTMTRLLQGMYPVSVGEILLDGERLADMDLAHLRDSMGVVLQENFIFHGTVRENIGVTRPGAVLEDVRRAARMAGAEEFIVKLSKGYDTVLEENGSNLSGGQKQRLAIARALLKDPRIMIFDEATSALDPESEARIQENLHRISAGRTMIIVAHRLSTLRHAGRIVVMDHGRITDAGTHAGLLETSEIYRNLWEKQTRGMQ